MLYSVELQGQERKKINERTSTLLIRSQMLYSVELQSRFAIDSRWKPLNRKRECKDKGQKYNFKNKMRNLWVEGGEKALIINPGDLPFPGNLHGLLSVFIDDHGV